MSQPPKIPPEQRAFPGQRTDPEQDAPDDRRDRATRVQSGQPGDADVNLETQGRFGNLKQNLTTHWKVQDR